MHPADIPALNCQCVTGIPIAFFGCAFHGLLSLRGGDQPRICHHSHPLAPRCLIQPIEQRICPGSGDGGITASLPQRGILSCLPLPEIVPAGPLIRQPTGAGVHRLPFTPRNA